MDKIPALRPAKMLKVLLKSGFFIHHQKGSHIQLRHLEKNHLRITIPFHSRFDLPPSVINIVLKQAEMNKEEFLRLLKK